jgi:phosphorylase/glycogen(starch) synthase
VERAAKRWSSTAFSTQHLDGWWVEGYDGGNGWTIGPVRRGYTEETGDPDREDANSLYNLLENVVIPMYYDRNASGVPEKWTAMIKRSMQTLAPVFNTERMLLAYLHQMYEPSAQREANLTERAYALARQIAEWKYKLPMRFSSLKLIDVIVDGVHGHQVIVDDPLTVNVRIDPGKMTEEEIHVEMIVGQREGRGFVAIPECIPLEPTSRNRTASLPTRRLTAPAQWPLQLRYKGVSHHTLLASKLETGWSCGVTGKRKKKTHGAHTTVRFLYHL